MDNVYGGLSVDDLLDLPSDDFFPSSSSYAVSDLLPSAAAAVYYEQQQQPSLPSSLSSDFNDILCVPTTEEAAELEWLSTYMDDSFTDFPETPILPTTTLTSAAAFHSRARSKRSRPTTTTTYTNLIKSTTSSEDSGFSGEEVHALHVGEDAAVEDGAGGPQDAVQRVRGSLQVGQAGARVPPRRQPDVCAHPAFQLPPQGHGAPPPEGDDHASAGSAPAAGGVWPSFQSLLTTVSS